VTRIASAAVIALFLADVTKKLASATSAAGEKGARKFIQLHAACDLRSGWKTARIVRPVVLAGTIFVLDLQDHRVYYPA